MHGRIGQRGQVLVVFAGGLVLLLLIASLVFDLGTDWMMQRQEQNAVDPGALAAAEFIPSDTADAPTSDMIAAACYYARQNGFFPSATTNDESATGCVSSNDPDHAALTVNYPPVGASAGEFAGRPGFVQVAITRQHSNYFMGIIGQPSSSVSASAVAANTTGDSNSYSLLALDPGCTNGAGQLGGNGGGGTQGKVSIIPATNPSTGTPYSGGYVQVNSTCQRISTPPTTTGCLSNGTAGLQVSGGSSISAPAINVSGTCANSGTITTDAPGDGVTQGALQVGDPLAELQPPTPDPTGETCPDGTTPSATNPKGCKLNTAGTYPMSPGTYYGGWSIGNNVTLQLSPGIYIMAGGGIKLNAGGSITSVSASGSSPAPILIFSTDDPYYHTTCMTSPGGTGCQAALDLTASSTLDISGLASGPYKGLVIWQDGNASCNTPGGGCNVTVGGQTNLSIAGTIYAPKVQVTLNGGSSTSGCTAGSSTPDCAVVQIISWWWQITGGSQLIMPYDPNQLYQLSQRGLVH